MLAKLVILIFIWCFPLQVSLALVESAQTHVAAAPRPDDDSVTASAKCKNTLIELSYDGRDLALLGVQVAAGLVVIPVAGAVCIVVTRAPGPCLLEAASKLYSLLSYSAYYLVIVYQRVLVDVWRVLQACFVDRAPLIDN